MTLRARSVSKVRLEVWVRPGKEQTLESLKAKFAGRILSENDNGEVLIAVSEDHL